MMIIDLLELQHHLQNLNVITIIVYQNLRARKRHVQRLSKWSI
jgi:hypothetical protein